METMKIGGREYPITGYAVNRQMGAIPLVGIPMMSEYKWLQSCLEDRLNNPELYRTALGEDVEAVIVSLRQTLAEYEEATA